MRVKNLRFLRCIDVFMIMISRFPAAEEHLSCSSTAGRHMSIQASFGDCLCRPEQVFSRVSCLIVQSGCTTQASERERGLRGSGLAVEAPMKRA